MLGRGISEMLYRNAESFFAPENAESARGCRKRGGKEKFQCANEFSGLKLNCLKRRSDQCFAQSSIAIMKIFQGVCWSKVSRHSLQKAKHLRNRDMNFQIFGETMGLPAFPGILASVCSIVPFDKRCIYRFTGSRSCQKGSQKGKCSKYKFSNHLYDPTFFSSLSGSSGKCVLALRVFALREVSRKVAL